MKLLLILLFWLPILVFGQQEKYSKVEITYDKEDLSSLLSLGLPLDHAHFFKNKVHVELSQYDISLLNSNNYQYTILVDDLIKDYNQKQSNLMLNKSGSDFLTCKDLSNDTITIPSGFTLGSMGGFLTYVEMIAHLDNMASKYPSLITVKKQIGSFKTFEGRSIYEVKISDNPNIDESSVESQILYDALHHAREPMSMSQLIFYMYYLLENYDTNAQVKYIVDNLEMYFVPCVNPDGYIYNETTNPLGGGLWRKNRRNNGDGTFGVDINRNYNFKWADNNTGSSPNTNSDTYRGIAAFSEPETRAMKFLCEKHNFKLSLNFHAYSNLLIMPDNFTQDSLRYIKFAETITHSNNYTHGIVSETLGYDVNGDSDLWMYGEQVSKNKQYSFTPEVGNQNDGFWPNQNRIIPIAQENVLANINAALLVSNYIGIEETSIYNINYNHNLEIELQSFGIEVPSTATVSVNSKSSAIDFIGSNITITNFSDLGYKSLTIPVKLKKEVLESEVINFKITIDYGDIQISKNISKIYSNQSPIINDDFESALSSSWKPDFWGLTDEYFNSSSHSITDSPYSNYSSNLDNELTFNKKINLTNPSIKEAYLQFDARWETENGFDYVQVIVNDGINDFPLCGNYTSQGVGITGQPDGEPLYDGIQDEWVDEYMNLSDFIGRSIDLRFVMTSDGANEMDGFYIDNFNLYTIIERENSLENRKSRDNQFTIYPNPAKDYIIIDINKNLIQDLIVINNLGQTVQTNFKNSIDYLKIDISDINKGLYFISILGNDNTLKSSTFIKK